MKSKLSIFAVILTGCTLGISAFARTCDDISQDYIKKQIEIQKHIGAGDYSSANILQDESISLSDEGFLARCGALAPERFSVLIWCTGQKQGKTLKVDLQPKDGSAAISWQARSPTRISLLSLAPFDYRMREIQRFENQNQNLSREEVEFRIDMRHSREWFKYLRLVVVDPSNNVIGEVRESYIPEDKITLSLNPIAFSSVANVGASEIPTTLTCEDRSLEASLR